MLRHAERVQNACAELKRACRGFHDGQRLIARPGAVRVQNRAGHGSVRVEQIAALAECSADGLCALRVRAEAAGEFRLHCLQHTVGNGITPGFGKLLHIAAHLFVRAGQQG